MQVARTKAPPASAKTEKSRGAGQTFYEGPNDIHTIGRNASKTRPAKFLVFLIKDKDAPISVPVK